MFHFRRVAQSTFGTGTRPQTNPHLLHQLLASTQISRPLRTHSPLQQTFGRGPQYRYTRYERNKNLFQRWAASPIFYYQVGGLAVISGGFYTYNLETVPVSGRRRFNIISPETEQSIAADQMNMILQQYKGKVLPEWDPRVRRVRRVLDRLIPNSGLQDYNWEVFVVASEERNAFVIPGGKVFVFTGILPVCEDDDGIAAVLGHEIAHNVAHHTAEKLSRYSILSVLAIVAGALLGTGDGIFRIINQFAFELPNGRAQESEADFIGLMMMSQSCYDPQGAISFWGRMVEAEKQHSAPPELLSTHPSSPHRVAKLSEWLPEAEQKRSLSECGGILDYAQEFRKQVRW